jgi:hypothetical protein
MKMFILFINMTIERT